MRGDATLLSLLLVQLYIAAGNAAHAKEVAQQAVKAAPHDADALALLVLTHEEPVPAPRGPAKGKQGRAAAAAAAAAVAVAAAAAAAAAAEQGPVAPPAAAQLLSCSEEFHMLREVRLRALEADGCCTAALDGGCQVSQGRFSESLGAVSGLGGALSPACIISSLPTRTALLPAMAAPNIVCPTVALICL